MLTLKDILKLHETTQFTTVNGKFFDANYYGDSCDPIRAMHRDIMERFGENSRVIEYSNPNNITVGINVEPEIPYGNEPKRRITSVIVQYECVHYFYEDSSEDRKENSHYESIVEEMVRNGEIDIHDMSMCDVFVNETVEL